jgi:hypothetical protein
MEFEVVWRKGERDELVDRKIFQVFPNYNQEDYLRFIMDSKPHKLTSLEKLRPVHTVDTNKCASVWSLNELSIWRSRILNSKNYSLHSPKLHGNGLPNV